MKHGTQSVPGEVAPVDSDVLELCDLMIAANGKPVGLPRHMKRFPGGVALGEELARRGYGLGVSGAGWSARKDVDE